MDTEFADLMEVGSLFHSFVAATVESTIPSLTTSSGTRKAKGVGT